MILLSIFLLVIGLIMVIKPSIVWLITESWKTNDASGPSDLYNWSTRFGGVMFIISGIGVMVVVLV
ncbi:hypothetical protein HNQ94_000155 [Salirhabdus euzebyi]|uniref:DUF6199 domain-containing protein n=1 Tax=Salirhabdus euzebyi TaxID=394506 RepID=A0A841PVI0_9BACI|nr:DUF6199 family natural product biosynthesis protein [Salirhabdus euzebyi]MBB6451734.1 hypothetical protein [Salirhabdus euzebyi]